MYSSLLLLLLCKSSLLLCYLLNCIDDITQYGVCCTVSIKLFEFEFEFYTVTDIMHRTGEGGGGVY